MTLGGNSSVRSPALPLLSEAVTDGSPGHWCSWGSAAHVSRAASAGTGSHWPLPSLDTDRTGEPQRELKPEAWLSLSTKWG